MDATKFDPTTAALRMARAKKLLVEAGGKRVSINLTARAVRAINCKRAATGKTQAAVIVAALEKLK